MKADRTGAGAGRGVSVAKLLAALGGAGLLGWGVVITSAAGVFVTENPFIAAAVAPHNPRVKIARGMTEFALQNGRVGDPALRDAVDALDRASLAEEPFLLAGISALASGQSADGEALLEEARRRNPRSRMARLILVDRYLRADRIEKAGVEIAVLSRLIPAARGVLIPELAKMVRDPASGTKLMLALRADRDMQNAVLGHLASTGTDPDLILQIAKSGGVAAASGGAPWQSAMISNLVGKGDVARAYAMWRGFTGATGEDGATGKGLYDGDFRDLPGSPPFNWQLNATNGGVAERGTGGGLQVEYYGRAPADLASQLLLLRPGRYRLQFQADGDASGEGSRLAWTISCSNGGKQQLAEVRLTDIRAAPRTVAGEFGVPAGCTAQWLRLAGIPDEFAGDQSATIRNLRIEQAGSR